MARKILISIFIVILTGYFIYYALWPKPDSEGLNVLRRHFELTSFKTEDRIVDDLGIYTSSRPLFYETENRRADLRRGLLRIYRLGEIQLGIYLRQRDIDAYREEGGGDIEKSPGYRKLRFKIIEYFKKEFSDPRLIFRTEPLPAPEDLTDFKYLRERHRDRLKKFE